ncbi:MAG: pitrilysin family protein [Flavobacteriaceae bacterium]|nr:pitrilysin family protein [Flavobacteriaceae bacterium]
MKNMKYIVTAFLVSGMLSAQSIDINKMPQPGATPTINITQPKTFQLKNGLQVLVVENNKLPRVNVMLTIDRPPIYEGEIAGIGEITSSQLGTGTATLSKDEFNKKIDFLGAHLNFNSYGARANTLSKYFPQVLELLADGITKPKFSAEEVQKSKDRKIESLKTEEKSADAIAKNVSDALLFGKNTAYGEITTEKSVSKIQLKDVQDFYQKYYAPNNAYLVIVGDVKFNDVKKLVEKNFKNWKKSNAKIQPSVLAKNVPTEINIVDVPSAVQSVIMIKNISPLQMKDPQYFAGRIANYILGGGGEARLFMNLREKNGFTYGAYSSLSTSRFMPHFFATASVRNEVTDKAVQEFMNELKGISTIKPEELKNAKEKLKGSFIMSLEQPGTIAEFALNQKLYNLPADFYTNYLKSIDKVTVKDVENTAKANILANQSRIFIAGKVADIAENVEKLGYPVKYFDREANPITKPEAKKINANITVTSVGQKYIDAIGGKTKVQGVNSLKMTSTGKVQGMELEMIIVQGKGGKMIQETRMMGNTLQKTVFDGKDGYIQAQGQKIPFPEEAKTSISQDIFPELSFGVGKFELKGIENINGEEAYAVKSENKTYFYSVATGLKLGEIAIQKMQGKEMSVPTYYSDYREVEGVRLPFKISSNMGGMEINFEVKSYEINKAKDSDFK